MSDRFPVKRDLPDADDEGAKPPKIMNLGTDDDDQDVTMESQKSDESSTKEEDEENEKRVDTNGDEHNLSLEIQETEEKPLEEVVEKKEEKKLEHSVYEQLTNFDHLVENFSVNAGIFGVSSCAHIPLGENVHLSNDVTNFVFVDAKKRKAWFSVFGENAIKWKDFKPEEVVHIEQFNWHKDTKKNSPFHGVTFEYCGSFSDESIMTAKPDLSVVFAKERSVGMDHIHSLLEIQKYDRIVLMLDHKNPKTVTANHKHKRVCSFSTSDGIRVNITAFESQCSMFDALEEHKAYIIENWKTDHYAHSSSDVWYMVTDNTTFVLTTVQAKEATVVKTSLKDLMATTATGTSTVYESDLFVRVHSGKCMNYYQCSVFEYDVHSDTQLTTIIKSYEPIQLIPGQKIRFNYQVKHQGTRMILEIVGALEILAESFPEPDKIDVFKCKWL